MPRLKLTPVNKRGPWYQNAEFVFFLKRHCFPHQKYVSTIYSLSIWFCIFLIEYHKISSQILQMTYSKLMSDFHCQKRKGKDSSKAGNIFKCIFLIENAQISIEISLKFVPKGPITNTPALVQIMAWHRPGDKPLSEPKMVRLPTHICITRPQWVNCLSSSHSNIIDTSHKSHNALHKYPQCTIL